MSIEAKAIGQLRTFLDSYGVCYQRNEEMNLWGVTAGECARWQWSAYATQEESFLVFIAHSPINVPKRRAAQVSEFLHHVNWGLAFGNFEMNWEKRQICFRTCVPLHGGRASRSALNELYFTSHVHMEYFLPGLLAVAIGNVDPKRAIEETDLGGPQVGEVAADSSADQAAGVSPVNGHGRLGGRFQGEN